MLKCLHVYSRIKKEKELVEENKCNNFYISESISIARMVQQFQRSHIVERVQLILQVFWLLKTQLRGHIPERGRGVPPLSKLCKNHLLKEIHVVYFLLWLKKQGCWWLFFQTLLTSSLSKGIHSNVVTKYDRHTFSPYIKIIINSSYRNNYFLKKHTKSFINTVVDNKKQYPDKLYNSAW